MSCCRFIIILISISTLVCTSCSRKTDPRDTLEGTWNAENAMNYLSDTISVVDGSYGDQSRTFIIKNDEGRKRHKYYGDCLISISNDSWLDILEIEFDNVNQGVISFYNADTSIIQKEEPRWTGSNYHFTIDQKERNSSLMIIDWGFSQFGRELDTLDFISVNPNVLILDSDTLIRIKLSRNY